MDPEATTLPLFGSAVILAGGQSRRMGFDKQTLEVDGQLIVDRLARALAPIFQDLLLVTNRPSLYGSLTASLPSVRLLADVFPGQGPMAGIHAGLLTAKSRFVYVIGCDMPYPSSSFISFMMDRIRSREDVAGAMLKRPGDLLEPLNAFYGRQLVPAMEEALRLGQSGLQRFCRTRPFAWVSEEEAAAHDPQGQMFRDFNRPQDLPEDRLIFCKPPSTDQLIECVPIKRVTGSGVEETDDAVIREIRCRLQIDGEASAFFHCLDDRLDDLAFGWMKLEGIIADSRQVTSLLVRDNSLRPDDRQLLVELAEPTRRTDLSGTPFGPPPEIGSAGVARLMRELDRRADLFRQTGGTHNMLLASRDLAVVDHCEEISRHHCLTKLVGRAIRQGRDLSGEILVASSRLTAGLIDLIVKAGLPLVISRAAVSSLAVRIAKKEGFGLIGFARDKRFNRYN